MYTCTSKVKAKRQKGKNQESERALQGVGEILAKRI